MIDDNNKRVNSRRTREWVWKKKLSSEHAITQEYIKFTRSFFPSVARFLQNRNNTLCNVHKKGSMAFWRVSYADEMEDCDRGENNFKVYRISQNEIIVPLRRSPIHLISVDCLVENLSDKLPSVFIEPFEKLSQRNANEICEKFSLLLLCCLHFAFFASTK